MKWKKLGLVYSPYKLYPWMISHASNPVVEILTNSIIRVYFSCRDIENRSSIAFIDFDLQTQTIKYITDKPLISPGEPGLFDDSGASVGCVIKYNQQTFLYYTGWNLAVTVPWRNSIGLAINQNGNTTFNKYAKAPIIDRNNVDPFSISYPWVIIDDNKWVMWYGSNLGWGRHHHDMQHVIKYAESNDGIHWDRTGSIAINLEHQDEWGISKPCVIKEPNGLYRMWYSYRGESYRIGYAESWDGVSWKRKDNEVGINVSTSGWDSEMIEYACIFDHDNQRYMLYNGNGFGKTGIGLAILGKN